MKIFSSIRKFLQLIFHLYSNCISLPLMVSEFSFSKNLQFTNYLMLSSILSYICYMKIFSFIQRCLHLLFQLYSKCICMPIIVSEIFLRQSSILSVILCNPQFYHIYVICFIRKCLPFSIEF